MRPKPPRFTAEDAERAHGVWGANCGPGALAAVCGLTLDEVRPHMGDFEGKGYTNPTLMYAALASIGARVNIKGPTHRPGWPSYGLARIQWHGPWSRPGVPEVVAYRHTHWVGACVAAPNDIGIFDINCMSSLGWVSLSDWGTRVVPWLLECCEPSADGRWSITHAIEVGRPAD